MGALRFAMATTFYPPYNFGGDGIFVERLAGALAARGHGVEVVYDPQAYELLAGGPPPTEAREQPGVTRRPLPRRAGAALGHLAAHQLGRPWGRLRAVETELAATDADVTHFHNVSMLGGPGVLDAGSGVKLCTFHDYWFICPMHTLWRYDREACERRTCLRCSLRGRRPPQLWRRGGIAAGAGGSVDAFLAPSRFTEQRHRDAGFDGALTHLPHFVPAPDATAGDTVEGLSGRPFFLYVGRLESLKGPQDLVEAFRDFADADLVVSGAGSQARALRRSAADVPQVRFLDWLAPERLSALYRAAEAVVVPSRCYETFGLTAAEAFAHGTPVVLRDHGALPELLADGGGIAFRTLADLRTAMTRLLREPGLRERLAREAEASYRANYREETHVARYLEIVERLIRRRAEGAR